MPQSRQSSALQVPAIGRADALAIARDAIGTEQFRDALEARLTKHPPHSANDLGLAVERILSKVCRVDISGIQAVVTWDGATYENVVELQRRVAN